MTAKRRIDNPILLICDLQEKFQPAIWEFSKVVATTKKMIKASQILSIPVYATTQNASRLGGLVPELSLSTTTSSLLAAPAFDKTAFSMLTPPLLSSLPTKPSTMILVGIESHICVTQTTLDLLERGHKVYILADGVSSCNKEEVPIALKRLAREGAVVTTSESMLYEIMGDAGIKEFKAIATLVKEEKDRTTETMGTLCKI